MIQLSNLYLFDFGNMFSRQAKEKNTRQIHTTCQPTGTTKKDKVKTVLALINELQLQDSTGSDEDVDISAS
jgi:hypothetical protein